MCLNNIGNVYHSLSDTDTALLFYDEAFAAYLTLEDQQGAIHALTNKAAALIDCDRLSKAADVLMKAKEISDQANISFPPLLTNTGLFLTKKQEFRNAEKVLNLALEKTDPQADSAIASVYFALGSLMLKTARYEESIFFFQKALKADQEASFYKGIADDLSSTGDAMALLGQQKDASFYYKRSVMIYALINNQDNKAATLHKLEKIAKQEGTDLSVINFFMDKWQKDGIGNTLCD